MEKSIVKDKELVIISPKVTNATRCNVTEVLSEEKFNVKLQTEEDYENNEFVEFFGVSGSGVLYFKTKIENIENDIITVSFPEKHTLIQRREYTRAEINKNILIYTDKKTIRATIIDISAGGMCLISDTKMDTKKQYQTDIKLEKNLAVSCQFKPVRVVDQEDNKFKVSGQFKLIKNIDRVALAQYCLKKQAEKEHNV